MDRVAESHPLLAVEALQLHRLEHVKSVGLVLTVTPGRASGSWKFFRFAACRITFSRERLSPHCLSTCTRACAALYP
jgi:hypothetical protein